MNVTEQPAGHGFGCKPVPVKRRVTRTRGVQIAMHQAEQGNVLREIPRERLKRIAPITVDSGRNTGNCRPITSRRTQCDMQTRQRRGPATAV